MGLSYIYICITTTGSSVCKETDRIFTAHVSFNRDIYTCLRVLRKRKQVSCDKWLVASPPLFIHPTIASDLDSWFFFPTAWRKKKKGARSGWLAGLGRERKWSQLTRTYVRSDTPNLKIRVTEVRFTVPGKKSNCGCEKTRLSILWEGEREREKEKTGDIGLQTGGRGGGRRHVCTPDVQLQASTLPAGFIHLEMGDF